MEMQRCIMSDEDLAVRMAKESSPVHLNRQRVRFSSIALSWERREKKKRSWRSDRDSLSLGRDKLKNASILRKYGSIWVGEKTRGGYCSCLISMVAYFFIVSTAISE